MVSGGKRPLNEYFKLMLNAKKKKLKSFVYTPKSGPDKGKKKLYERVEKHVKSKKNPKGMDVILYKFKKYIK
tara:strand:+ start:1452 stop:1667 length:216 start_codon:yes stop_codon:yes gene_type:complete